MPDGVGHVAPEAKRTEVGERENAMSSASEALEFNYTGV